jgi:hypothetical protein
VEDPTSGCRDIALFKLAIYTVLTDDYDYYYDEIGQCSRIGLVWFAGWAAVYLIISYVSP